MDGVLEEAEAMISKTLARAFCLFIALLPFITTLFILSAHAQEVGPAFSFSDLSLQKTDVKIYQLNNGSMVYVTTINTSSDYIYDPTSDYIMVFQPTLASTYGSSPEGLIAFIQDNPELAALVLICIVLFVLLAVAAFMILRRR